MDNIENQIIPIMVPSLKEISAVVAGAGHSLVFPQEGGLLVFGYNFSGQLGLNHTTNQIRPTPSPLQPAFPHSSTRSRKKSARFL